MKMIRQVLTVLGLTGMLFSMTACGKQTKTEAPEASYIASFLIYRIRWRISQGS